MEPQIAVIHDREGDVKKQKARILRRVRQAKRRQKQRVIAGRIGGLCISCGQYAQADREICLDCWEAGARPERKNRSTR